MNEIVGWSSRGSVHQNWWHTGLTLMVLVHMDGADGKWNRGRHIFLPGTDQSYTTIVTVVRELIWRIFWDVKYHPTKHRLIYQVERGSITLEKAIEQGFIVPEEEPD